MLYHPRDEANKALWPDKQLYIMSMMNKCIEIKMFFATKVDDHGAVFLQKTN